MSNDSSLVRAEIARKLGMSVQRIEEMEAEEKRKSDEREARALSSREEEYIVRKLRMTPSKMHYLAGAS